MRAHLPVATCDGASGSSVAPEQHALLLPLFTRPDTNTAYYPSGASQRCSKAGMVTMGTMARTAGKTYSIPGTVWFRVLGAMFHDFGEVHILRAASSICRRDEVQPLNR